MHDALQLERLGVPATVVITAPFQGLAARTAESLGLPGYPAVVVPHPISTRDAGQLARLAAEVADAVEARLTAPAPAVARA